MLRFLSFLITTLFHPLLYVFYVVVYLLMTTNLFYFYRTKIQIIYLLIVTLISTVVLPIIFNYFTYKSYNTTDKHKDLSKLITTAFIYLIFMYFADTFYIPQLITHYLRISLMALTLIIILQFRIKVCYYSAGISLMWVFGILLSMLNPGIHFKSLVILTVLTGIIISARIYLGKSEVNSTIIGTAIGIVSGIPVLLLYQT